MILSIVINGNIMTFTNQKILFVSTPVGALGTGLGGGVELTLYNAAKEMLRRGHYVQVVAPADSHLEGIPVHKINGQLQIPAQNQNRIDPIVIPDDSVLANMWSYVRETHREYDLILNFSYDWLPLYLTPFLMRPVAHIISMSSLTNAMDRAIEAVISQFPGTVAVHGKTQSSSFSFSEKLTCIFNGLDISQYHFCDTPDTSLAWVGRIAPEKGLEDAVAVAKITGIPLKIMGKIQDENYWQKICTDYPQAPVEYLGFLTTVQMQAEVGKCRALLMTPRWVEAFGNVAIEALACGVPVISYRRGGPAEIIRDGQTGFLVEPDSVDGLVGAIARLNEIDRRACRQQVELEYSLEALGSRLENWFKSILDRT